MNSTAIVYTVIGMSFLAALALWIWVFRELTRDAVFSEGSKKAWFWVILLGQVGGAIAYLTARKLVAKYSLPDATRLECLLKKER